MLCAISIDAIFATKLQDNYKKMIACYVAFRLMLSFVTTLQDDYKKMIACAMRCVDFVDSTFTLQPSAKVSAINLGPEKASKWHQVASAVGV